VREGEEESNRATERKQVERERGREREGGREREHFKRLLNV
jgi:hypothetical protein